MDDKSVPEPYSHKSCRGDTAETHTSDVPEVTPLQTDSNIQFSECKSENTDAKQTSSREKNDKESLHSLPGRDLTRVTTLPNIAKDLVLFPTNSLNDLHLPSRLRTEWSHQSDTTLAVGKEATCTTTITSPTLNTPDVSSYLNAIGEHHVSSLPDNLQGNLDSIDQCPQRIFQDLLGSFRRNFFDDSRTYSDSSLNIIKRSDSPGTLFSPCILSSSGEDKQNEPSIAVADTDNKHIPLTNKKPKSPRKKKKVPKRDTSKDSSNIDETPKKKTVGLHKSKKRLSFKDPIEDQSTSETSARAGREAKEKNKTRKNILKNKGNAESSPKKSVPKESSTKSSSTTNTGKKCLSGKLSSSNSLSKKKSVSRNSLKDEPSRDRSVEKHFSDISIPKPKTRASMGYLAATKASSNRAIKVKIVRSQPQTSVSSKSQKNILTNESKKKRTTSSLKDSRVRKESASSFSSVERVSKKQTISCKNHQSKQRTLKVSSKAIPRDSNSSSREVTSNKDSSSVRKKINPSTSIEHRDKVRETSKDRVEHKTLSKAASQPISQHDTSNSSSRSGLPKAASETNHCGSEAPKNISLFADLNQLFSQRFATNPPLKEQKLKTHGFGSEIEVVSKKQPVRETGTPSKGQSSSTRSSHSDDTSDGCQATDRHEPKSRRAIASDDSPKNNLKNTHSKSRSRESHTLLKIPSKEKTSIDTSSSVPITNVKRRNTVSLKDVPDTRQISTEGLSKTQRTPKSSSKNSLEVDRSNVHSIEVTIKPKIPQNTEKKLIEAPRDSSSDISNKCLLSSCRPVSEVKIKSKSNVSMESHTKQNKRKHQSKENLSKEHSNAEKIVRVLPTADKEAKGDTLNESNRKIDSKERTIKVHPKSTEEKQKSMQTERRKLSAKMTNKARMKKCRVKKKPKSRIAKERRVATCCGGGSQVISVKTRKRLESHPGVRSGTSKSHQASPVHSDKEILTIHRSRKSSSYSRVTEGTSQKKLHSEDQRYSDDSSDSDSDSTDSMESNLAIFRDRRNLQPYLPRIRRKRIKHEKVVDVHPSPVLYRKSSIRLAPIQGYNFGIMYPVDLNAPEPGLRSIGSSIAKETRRARKVSQLEEKPVLFYESVGENFYQTPRAQSIIGHDLIAPPAPVNRVPAVAREKCLFHEKLSGPTKYNVRVRSPLPCICRRPRRLLVRDVPETYDPSATTTPDKFSVNYHFKDLTLETPLRRSQDHVKEFLYDLGKSILPPERYRGKLVGNSDWATAYSYRSGALATNNAGRKPSNKSIR